MLESPLIADPLHRLDCCVITDGGALVVVHPDLARDLGRRSALLRGYGEAHKDAAFGQIDLTYSAQPPRRRAGVRRGRRGSSRHRLPRPLRLVTITVLLALEGLGSPSGADVVRTSRITA